LREYHRRVLLGDWVIGETFVVVVVVEFGLELVVSVVGLCVVVWPVVKAAVVCDSDVFCVVITVVKLLSAVVYADWELTNENPMTKNKKLEK